MTENVAPQSNKRRQPNNQHHSSRDQTNEHRQTKRSREYDTLPPIKQVDKLRFTRVKHSFSERKDVQSSSERKDIRRKEQKPRVGRRALSDEEIRKMCAWFDVHCSPTLALRNKTLLTLGCKVGFRAAELVLTRVRDVWQNGGWVYELTLYQSKVNRSRSVLLSDEAKQILDVYLTKAGLKDKPDVLLFPIKRHRVWKLMRQAARGAGLPELVGAHSLRKTMAVNCFRNTRNLIETRDMLGQKSVAVTEAYLGNTMTEDRRRKAVSGAAFADLL